MFFNIIGIYFMSNTIIRVGEKGRDSRVPGGKLMKNKTKKKDVLNK